MKRIPSLVALCSALILTMPSVHAGIREIPDSSSADAVYQYSVPMQGEYRRAYLWIPANCQHVRGIIIGIQNMLEQSMFADAHVRQAAADAGLGIVWITPGDDGSNKESPFHRFNPPQQVVDEVKKVLADLATESGYSEIENAPLMVTAHSAATPFVWGMGTSFDSARIIAIFPCKGWFGGGIVPGIPTFHISSEYSEVGGEKWGETFLKDRGEVMRLRSAGDDRLIGEFVDIGAGHYEWNPNAAPILGMFIRKAAQYRLPATFGTVGKEQLKTIDPKSGWLIDPAKLGTQEGKPVAYNLWQGDPKKALWYLDRELAQAVNDYMASNLAKKPQVIDFVDQNGKPQSLEKGGAVSLSFKLMPDGASFKVVAGFLDQAPPQIYGGAQMGHASGPILFKASSGAIKQTGSDTFRIWMKRGGLIQQGSPWEPQIIAWHPGDEQYRRADRPGHPWLYTFNKDGKAQTIDFPKIPDQRVGIKSLKLHATSDAGLPVQFYVISGPVQLSEGDNSILQFLPIPPRSKLPVKVIIGAYQWGRVNGEKVQTAGPLFQEFYIQK